MSEVKNSPRDEQNYRQLGPPVRSSQAGLRFDAFLSAEFRFLSRHAWQQRIGLGHALVNRKKKRSSYKLKEGDQLSMYYPDSFEPEVDDKLAVLWNEGGVAVIAKPPGLPMHMAGAFFKTHFANSLKELLGDSWAAVHRIDRETSGSVLVANTPELRAHLTAQFQKSSIEKKYLCIGTKIPSRSHWRMEDPIGDGKSQIRIKKWINTAGQSAKTEFVCLDSAANACLLEAKPITGRTNQIRVHAAFAGHTLLGDRLYNKNEEIFLDYDKNGDNDWQFYQTGFSRTCLHAYSISFVHPNLLDATSKPLRITVTCPMWPDMQELWRFLKSSS